MATAAVEIRGDQVPAEEISSPAGPAIRLLPSLRIVTPDPRPHGQPDGLLLGTLGKRGFRLVKPIPVRLEKEGGMVIASWPETDEFGTGTSMSLACEDLGRTVAELYESLKADKHRLGPDLLRVWTLLQEHVVEFR